MDLVPAVCLLEWPSPAKNWTSSWLSPSNVSSIKRPDECHGAVKPSLVPKIHPTGIAHLVCTFNIRNWQVFCAIFSYIFIYLFIFANANSLQLDVAKTAFMWWVFVSGCTTCPSYFTIYRQSRCPFLGTMGGDTSNDIGSPGDRSFPVASMERLTGLRHASAYTVASFCAALKTHLFSHTFWHWQHVTLYFVTCSWSAVRLHHAIMLCDDDDDDDDDNMTLTSKSRPTSIVVVGENDVTCSWLS